MALPVWIIPAGCQSQTTLVQCRGAKSHVYDMYTGQGVVSSRAVFVYCDLLRLSYDRVFCSPNLGYVLPRSEETWVIFVEVDVRNSAHI